LVENAYLRAKKVLTEHKERHKKLAERLLEKEVLFSEDLEEIFGKRPGFDHHKTEENTIANNTETTAKIEA